MKTLLTLTLLFITFSLGAQNISDFKYIYVPLKFTDYKTNNAYNLNKILVSKLSDKTYNASQVEPKQWAANLGEDPCQILSAELVDTSTMLRNRVRLEFKDCNGQVVGQYEATSRIKDFHAGYQDALLQAVALVPGSTGNGVSITSQVLSVNETPIQNQVQSTSTQSNVSTAPVKSQRSTVVESADPKTPSTAPAKAQELESSGFQVFSWNGVNYTKVNLGSGHFILTQPKNTEPFAEFKESARKGVFHVTMKDQVSTIGYSEGTNYVVELRDKDGDFTKAVFVGN